MAEQALLALGGIFRPDNFVFLIVGVMGGMVVGALPGLTATMALALLVPFTFTMSPDTALIMLGGLYTAAMYSDAIPAILINTPGTPSAIATSFDGYPMSRQGRAQEALAAAAVASGIGGIIGGVFLLVLSPPLAEFGLKFGPPEYFWLAVFGLTIIAPLAAGDLLKGLAGGALGLLFSTVGIAPIGGDIRFTFGYPQLQAGITFVVALIGLFCIPQMLTMIEEHRRRLQVTEYGERSGVFRAVFRDILKKPANVVRSSVIGTIVGIIPGAGGSIASLISYNEATRWSRDRDQFGKGNPAGVVASEAANSSQVPGALIPMLTLGIPGTPPAAVVMGALFLHGLRPGRELFTMHSSIVYTFMFSLFLGAITTMVIGGLGSRFFARVIDVPIRYVAPVVVFLSFIGSYAIRNNMLDVGIMLFCGFVGYVTLKLGLHSGPIVLGLILGPYAEQGLIQSVLMGRASGSILQVMFARPISVILIALCLLSVLWPVLARRRGALREAPAAEPEVGAPAESRLNVSRLKASRLGLNTDWWSGILMSAVALFALTQSRSFSDLGGLFVRMAILICAAVGVGLLIAGWQKRARTSLFPEDGDPGSVFVTAAGLIVYALLTPWLGFIAASVLAVTGLTAFLAHRSGHALSARPWLIAGAAVVAFCLVFRYGFIVPLPVGTVWEAVATVTGGR